MRGLAIVLFIFSGLFAGNTQTDIPLRAEEDYELKIDYNFKKKPVPSIQETNYALIQERNNISLLPHLTVFVSLKNKTDEEFRIRVVDNKGKINHSGKIKDVPLELVLGYMVDIKEKVTANRWEVIILTKKKAPINKIVLEITKDGLFYVNEIESGKF